MRPLAAGGRLKEAENETRSAWGLDDSLMTEHAARSVLEAILEQYPQWGEGGMVIACGRGGNGADGLALAALAARLGLRVRACVLLSGALGPEASRRLDMVERASVPVIGWEKEGQAARDALSRAGILLDAVAGTGLTAPLRPEAASLCAFWNACSAPRVALDLPTGLREGWRKDEPFFHSDLCLAIGLLSLPVLLPAARARCGMLRVVSGGVFPQSLLEPRAGDPLLLDEGDLDLPPLDPDGDKFSRGRLAVFAGSADGAGAAQLCARAAARAGAGLVDLVLDTELWKVLAPGAGGIRIRSLPEVGNFGSLDRFLEGSAVLAGPGWGRGGGRAELLELITSRARSLVLDADALNILSEKAMALPARSILTPHWAEAARLLAVAAEDVEADPAQAALALSLRYHAVVIVKGPLSWIASPDGSLAAWEGRMAECATGGSGDVLAGIAAGLLARGLDATAAARQAVILHARAAHLARSERGAFLAEELCERVSLCLTKSPREESHA